MYRHTHIDPRIKYFTLNKRFIKTVSPLKKLKSSFLSEMLKM